MTKIVAMKTADDLPVRALIEELDRWSAAHLWLDVWWRDDDMTGPSPALDRLLAASEGSGAPLALAAVPAGIDDRLAPSLDDRLFTVLQHGSSHRNFASEDARAVECGGDRPLEDILASLKEGRERLASLFGSRFVPVMVPPWNRIEPRVVERLAALGYRGLSTFGETGPAVGLGAQTQSAGLPQLNAHLDLLTWKGGACFAGREKLYRLAAERIAGRRERCARAIEVSSSDGGSEPFGLLTHHRDHDEATWTFLTEILGILSFHPSVRLKSVSELLP